MALLCFNPLAPLSSQRLQLSSFASPVFSLKPNTVESKNRVSLSAYNLSSGCKRAVIVKAAASGVDGAEPESNEEPPKTVVAAVPVDKLPLESKEAKEKLLLEQRMKMKLAKKIRLRRKRLVRKRKLRKKGRWPPSKMKKLKNV
ncbi:hypothetical protein F2Q68_00041653 [Brassica cretica]|uniref:50S ribosomal protein 5, chloroplastic n=1 Tax=Brassica cretica TaxID=69181 RepID=A0A3N6PYY6_BRACR|nr:PREDICTED: 50S ribosomal protein 5, chloroplastic [Brassica oleracea var. oleracea]KAF2616520.1 hypothetical protein F2Q68_00041653 [Brassica cretica]